MIFTWIRNARRRRLLATPFPPPWLEILHASLPAYARLSPDEQARLRDTLRILVAEKFWEGCDGLRVTDEMRVTIAAHAALLVLGHSVDLYRRISSVLIFPNEFESARDDSVLSQAYVEGTVLLSWEDVLKGVRRPGNEPNVILHEFAHQLDLLDRDFAGTPPLETWRRYQRWRKVIGPEYRKRVEASGQDRITLVDRHAASCEGEFYAVATECFFERPIEMRKQHPELYEILRDYYRQDPAARG